MISLHHGESVSPWIETIEMPSYLALDEDIDTEICIVGGGLAGLLTAYCLQQEGKKVCIVESYELGSGQSGKSTAHCTYALDKGYRKLVKYHGEKTMRLVAQSHIVAIKKIVDIISKEKIECELERVNGYFFNSNEDIQNLTLQSNREKNYELLNLELEALMNIGMTDVYMTERIPIHSFDPGPALCYPDQIQLNPLKFIKGLAECLVRRGANIFTNSHVIEINGGEAAYIKLENNHIITCESIVVATNTPINDVIAIHTKQSSYRTYVIGLEVPKGSVIKGLYWDNQDPYHYIRLEKNTDTLSEVIFVGGEDHKTGQKDEPEHCYTRLENWARKKFPQAGKITHRWSGHVMEPVDGIAYIGRNPMDSNNVYVVTGHSGNGLTYSTIAGILLTDLIHGKENPWESIYNPSRINFNTTGNYIKENINSLFQYRDWFLENHSEEIKNLPNGKGIVYREGFQIVAAYKDQYGHLNLNSATCPHLGGIVRWNDAEKSWDCPCHGSRFDCLGKMIEGPANVDLTPINIPAMHPPDTIKVWDITRPDPNLN